jgi:hypothetical protein
MAVEAVKVVEIGGVDNHKLKIKKALIDLRINKRLYYFFTL